MDVYHYLYLSRFTGRVGDTGLRDILQRSREQNLKIGITGALLFDGERFVQLLEGAREPVAALAERIRRDPRHREFTPLYEGSLLPPVRCFRRWMAGYAEAEAVTEFEQRFTAGAVAAPVDAFMALVGASDVE